MWKEFWEEVAQPTGAEISVHYWSSIAAGHILIGAAVSAVLTALFGLPVLSCVLAVIILYWLIKEARDLLADGSPRDSLIDAGFVGVGAAYAGPWWWPVGALGLIAVGISFYRVLRE